MSRRELNGPPPEPGPSAREHDHLVPPPRWIPRAVLALAATCLLLVAGLVVSWVFIYQQQQYIEGRGERRDIENERLNQRINDAICDLLDQLPEGGLLDGPRERYGCGPGRPLEDFPEDIRNRYAPTPAPASPTTAPPTTASTPPAVPEPSRPTPNEPPAGNSPKPTPTAPPTSPRPLDPITDTVCDALGICLEVTP